MTKTICLLLILLAGFTCSNASKAYAENLDIQSLIQDARNSDTHAMVELGLLYYHGKGVLKDPFKAKCWIKNAHDAGSKRAKKIWNEFELWKYSGKCEDSFDDEISEKYQKGDSFTEPILGMIFIWVPKGCYTMGCHELANIKLGKIPVSVSW